jgi:hypothetical protein
MKGVHYKAEKLNIDVTLPGIAFERTDNEVNDHPCMDVMELWASEVPGSGKGAPLPLVNTSPRRWEVKDKIAL